VGTKAARNSGERPLGEQVAYDRAYGEAIVQHCQRGGSVSTFARSIGVPLDTLVVWRKADPEFAQSWKRAFSVLACELDDLTLAVEAVRRALRRRAEELEPDFRALAGDGDRGDAA